MAALSSVSDQNKTTQVPAPARAVRPLPSIPPVSITNNNPHISLELRFSIPLTVEIYQLLENSKDLPQEVREQARTAAKMMAVISNHQNKEPEANGRNVISVPEVSNHPLFLQNHERTALQPNPVEINDSPKRDLQAAVATREKQPADKKAAMTKEESEVQEKLASLQPPVAELDRQKKSSDEKLLPKLILEREVAALHQIKKQDLEKEIAQSRAAKEADLEQQITARRQAQIKAVEEEVAALRTNGLEALQKEMDAQRKLQAENGKASSETEPKPSKSTTKSVSIYPSSAQEPDELIKTKKELAQAEKKYAVAKTKIKELGAQILQVQTEIGPLLAANELKLKEKDEEIKKHKQEIARLKGTAIPKTPSSPSKSNP